MKMMKGYEEAEQKQQQHKHSSSGIARASAVDGHFTDEEGTLHISCHCYFPEVVIFAAPLPSPFSSPNDTLHLFLLLLLAVIVVNIEIILKRSSSISFICGANRITTPSCHPFRSNDARRGQNACVTSLMLMILITVL